MLHLARSVVSWFPCLVMSLVLATVSSAQKHDFEASPVASTPSGWMPGFKGSEFAVTDDHALEGAHCAQLRRGAGAREAASAVCNIDARPHRGKIVVLRGGLKAGGGAHAHLWLRVDLPDDQTGFFDNMRHRPVTADSWQRAEVVGFVAENAEQIVFGVLLTEGDQMWVDDVELEFADGTGAAAQPPAPLTERGLANVTAFARLCGYVRYFHASDAAAALDWERFIIDGMRDVEQAADASALAADLQRRFAGVAPTMSVAPTGHAVARPIAPPDVDPEGLQVAAWVHQGVGIRSHSTYKSHREFVAIAERDALPDPAKPLSIDLGGGVTCSLPVAVYARAERTLPVMPAAVPARRPVYGCEDRATRLAAVALAWNVLQHFYPYFELTDCDWQHELGVALHQAAFDVDGYAFLDTMRRLVASLGDGHGMVQLDGDLRYASPPVAVSWLDGCLVITAVGDGAEQVAVGDVVTEIDGVAAREVFEAAKARAPGATDQFRCHAAALTLLYGELDSVLTLTVARPGDPSVEVKLVRRVGGGVGEARPDAVAELEPGIWYVDFDRTSDAEFEAALADLATAQAIVFDCRGYPRRMKPKVMFGHLIDTALESPHWLVPRCTLPDRADVTFIERERWRVEPQAPRLRARCVFVTAGGAVSYAESCLALVEHYRLGEIVGGPTAGTNGNVNPVSLPGGLTVYWTGMRVLKHDRSTHHGIGIQPTVPVARTVAGVRRGEDELLLKALEIAKREPK